jgi:hypothetical protein
LDRAILLIPAGLHPLRAWGDDGKPTKVMDAFLAE